MRRFQALFLLSFLLWLAACSASGASAPPATPTLTAAATQGKTLFTRECASCHSLSEGTVIVGPSLAHVATQAAGRAPEQDAENYLLASIIDPSRYVVEGYQDLMPATFGKRLTGEEIDAILAFLLTLE